MAADMTEFAAGVGTALLMLGVGGDTSLAPLANPAAGAAVPPPAPPPPPPPGFARLAALLSTGLVAVVVVAEGFEFDEVEFAEEDRADAVSKDAPTGRSRPEPRGDAAATAGAAETAEAGPGATHTHDPMSPLE